MLKVFVVLSAFLIISCESLAPNPRQVASIYRRSILLLPFVTAAGVPIAASALDVDAFISQELSKDECDPRTAKKCTKKLTNDEALCKFGQPSKERGDACVRAGQSTKLTKNGVDAYGKVDRGDFQRCKQFYDLEGGKYVEKTVCGLAPS